MMIKASVAKGTDAGAGEARKRPKRNDEDLERPQGSLRTEAARVRARFGMDPATRVSVLPEPWTSPSGSVEEDEAELADALADCLSVGLSLNAAVASWISGDLAHSDEQDDQADQFELGLFAS